LKELERDAHKSEGVELIEEHLRRLGRVVVNLDAEGVAEVGRDDDRIASIPAVQDIRNHLRTTPLTKREREVLNLRAQNWDFQGIGDHLGISASTARVLMMRVRRAAGQQRLSSTRKTSAGRHQMART
jgi:DNA-binding CsgD family transcriptional regulator